MKVYLLVNEETLGYKHNIALVSDETIKDDFVKLQRFNKFEEFELDDESIISKIKEGSSSDPWIERWRDRRII